MVQATPGFMTDNVEVAAIFAAMELAKQTKLNDPAALANAFRTIHAAVIQAQRARQ